ncbi:hypothetical protein BOSEA31B_12541 [Hyphomicrobiales bacterium]|nr:hypothetical protein BOSEA31B_11782 [Hyphomicrobiales bacterium]CAH1663408.1 hypothetical protein BOSEA31B_12541 [Hyphomicrobiales bacterium]CAH1697573.1 hypothetical protein BOSEA1005_10610 [Hyphomicrobiales bacterium]CAH1698311.1 hypothetical protein BOSEA1005_11364 [Hyphomicrobiales bacterium]CAI0347212.1 hypothetical protein BO1005MUT1_620012 [Hyphomicrobiales bacterium]
MSLTSYRAAPPRVNDLAFGVLGWRLGLSWTVWALNGNAAATLVDRRVEAFCLCDEGYP